MQYRFQCAGLASAICLLGSLVAPSAVHAQVPLTRADIEALYNDVVYLPESGQARPASLSDWLDLGDALRTAPASRADLRFNDGSLARVGERATFWFVPNTRTFRLSNGTALFLVPPGRGPSTIQTPSVVTGIQGTAVIVRHIPEVTGSARPDAATTHSGRTIVMALTNNPGGPVKVTLANGQSVDLVAGEMAIAANGALEVFEFDLQLFYETSPLVADLHLDDPNYPDTGAPTDPVRQETLDGLAQQANFAGENMLNPAVLDFEVVVTETLDWQVPGTEPAMTAATRDRSESATQPLGETNPSPLAEGSDEHRRAIVSPTPETSVFSLDSLLPADDVFSGNAASASEVGNGSAPPPGVVQPAPTLPAAPVIPASPLPIGNPAGPAGPVTEPDDSDNPQRPAIPAEPGEPGNPARPAIPADPGEPGTPATPATPAQPAAGTP